MNKLISPVPSQFQHTRPILGLPGGTNLVPLNPLLVYCAEKGVAGALVTTGLLLQGLAPEGVRECTGEGEGVKGDASGKGGGSEMGRW